jgi:hypothetical protein
MDFNEILYWEVLLKCDTFQFWLQWNSNNGHFTIGATSICDCKSERGNPQPEPCKWLACDDIITQQDRHLIPHPHKYHWSQTTLSLAPFIKIKGHVSTEQTALITSYAIQKRAFTNWKYRANKSDCTKIALCIHFLTSYHAILPCS